MPESSPRPPTSHPTHHNASSSTSCKPSPPPIPSRCRHHRREKHSSGPCTVRRTCLSDLLRQANRFLVHRACPRRVRFFLYGAEGQVVKNRVHVCLQPADHDRDTEVDHLLALGTTMLADHRTPDGAG